MADITKCSNEKCSKKESCFRYVAVASHYQSYAEFEEEECEYYIRMKPREVKAYEDAFKK